MTLLPRLVAPTDAMFLLPETREQPMHVGSLQLFTAPEGSGPDALTELYHQALATPEVAELFRKRPVRGLGTAGQWAWRDDEAIDLEHHVRHSSLPRPGRIRELLALSSRLHGTLLDRQRPLWEMHLIEGLADGRFAVYTKLHHALMDGVSGLRLLERSLSTDPDARDTPMPFAARPRPERTGEGFDPLGAITGGAKAALDAVTLLPRLASLLQEGLTSQGAVLPMQAPRSMLNVPITGSRRFAADDWSLTRIRTVAKAAGGTINDVVLAMSAAALRDYLLSLDALPDAPLVAMTPVSLRQDDSSEGNAVGSILVSLGTHLSGSEERMLHIMESSARAKAALHGLSQLQVSALSAGVMAPLLLNTYLGVPPVLHPPFNLVISNVPGPRQDLYWNGAHLDGMYPLSIPSVGQALNITVTSYVDSLQFGLTGCRRTLPHLQQLLSGLEEGLSGLEAAFL
jgi:WS/DGAT/MGAT family acyltransferase